MPRVPSPCENTPVNPWLLTAPAAALATATSLTIYGAVNPRAQLFGPTICRTSAARQFALTFDDGPNPSITPKLLGLLDRYQVRATFFLIGRYARECPHLVREITALGHVIGNHTQTHPNLFWLGPAQIRDELRRCQDAIACTSVAAPKWFRPPFGLRNPALAGAARELDLRVVMWTLLPGDWRAKSDEWLIDRITPIADRAQAASHFDSGDVLCLHDGSHRGQNADRNHTLAALEHWLPRWRDLGLEFVTIEDAVRTPVR
jgi:peptidoglycan/xylan/chitin deacetylase (PgdA/CDA1 family)